MPLLSNGQYRIFNAQFTTQDADLIDGQPMSPIRGYYNNSYSFNMVWNLTNVGNKMNELVLSNAAPSANGAYAFTDQAIIGAGLHGSPNASIWTLVPMPTPGEYWILAPSSVNSSIPSGLAWSLASGDNGSQITLAPIDSNDLSQGWIFHPQVGGVGNVARALNDLD